MSRPLPVVERNIADRAERVGTLLKYPFSKQMNETLMGILPSSARHWEPDMEGWWIAPEHHDRAVQLLLQQFGSAMFIGADGDSDYIMDKNGEIIEQGGLFD